MIGSKFICGGVITLTLLLGGMNAICLADTAGETDTYLNAGESSEHNASRRIIKSNSAFDVTLECGLAGYFDPDGGRVRVKVVSDGDFKGKVSVAMAYDTYTTDYTDGYPDITYSKDVELSSGEAGVLDYYVSNNDRRQVIISIYDDAGELVYSESDSTGSESGMTTVSVRSAGEEFVYTEVGSSDEQVIVGILSDDATTLKCMGSSLVSCGPFTARAAVLDISGEELPDSEAGYTGIDYIYIDGFDISELTEKQRKAIEDWCALGGSLILAVGDDGEILDAFGDDFLDAGLTGTHKTSFVFNAMGTEDDDSANSYAFGDVTVADISVEGSVTKTLTDGLWMNVREYGDGRISVLPYSLCSLADKEYGGAAAAASYILSGAVTSDILSGISQRTAEYYMDGYGFDTAEQTNKRGNLSPAAIIIALLVYIVLSCPLTYFILKLKKRREYMWIVLPAWAVLGTVAIYVMSRRYAVTKPVSSTFVVADISGDNMVWNMYTDLITSKTGEYSVKLNAESDVLKSEVTYNRQGMAIAGNLELTESAEGRSLNYTNSAPFENLRLYGTEVCDNDIGTIEKDIRLYTDGFEGSLTNNTPYNMSNVVAMSDNAFYCIDSLAAGATVYISRADNMKCDVSDVYYGDAFEQYYKTKYAGDGEAYSVPGFIENRNQYMQYRYESSNRASLGEGSFAVWADIDCEPPYFSDDVENYGSYLVYSISTVEYADVEGSYYGNIFDCAVQNDNFDSEDMMMYADEVDIKLVFVYDDDITEITYGGQRPESGQQVTTEAYNYDTGKYESVFVGDSAAITGESLKHFVRNNVMYMRFRTDSGQSDYYPCYLPYITAKGGSR